MTAARCSGADGAGRAGIVAAARGWIGTPYCHQASLKGVGADCLGLVRGVWREVCGTEPELPPPYSPAWGELSRTEPLLAAARRHMAAIPAEAAGPGDVLLFRMIARGPAKHLGILSRGSIAGGWMIHAYSDHAVCESALTAPWQRRIAACFRFPERTS